MPPESTSTSPEANDESELSPDDQITDLLSAAGETGEIDEPEQKDPPEESKEATQEDKSEKDDKSETDESKQEAADETATWGQALGIPDDQIVLDDDGNFQGVMTKIEGETKQVDLKELVKGYQIDGYNTNRSKAMAEERKQFEQYANQQAQEYQQKVTEATGLVDNLKQQIVGEYESINWEALRIADPAEYAARKQDFAVRYQQVQQQAENIAQQQAQLTQQQQTQEQQANYKHLQVEAQRALEMKPEWTDPDVRTKAIVGLQQYVVGSGFTQQEAEGITDHRLIPILEKAMAYDAIKKGSAQKIKTPVPKFNKPGGKPPAASKKTQLNKLYKNAAASSDRRVKDDAITQLLFNS